METRKRQHPQIGPDDMQSTSHIRVDCENDNKTFPWSLPSVSENTTLDSQKPFYYLCRFRNCIRLM